MPTPGAPKAAAPPRLSVVVPVHNVAPYLEECLASLAAQSMTALDVVLVDDGSTDDSPRIAQEFTRRDARFRYVRQPNAGLSAARNTGVAHTAPGTDYLAFVDSDDVLAPHAYARLTASLDASGSDLASGNVWRLHPGGRRQAWQYRWLTADRTGTHITREPRLLTDRVAWNKVFRRSFWDRHGFTYPVGRLYEDTPVVIPAHYLARSVDVLHEHVYYWRVREGSITRLRTDVRGVRDRIAACADVSAFLARARPDQLGHYDTSCLRDDFVYFLEGLPMGGPDYRAAFMTGARAFLERAGADATRALPPHLRVKWQLVREDRLAELVEVLAFEQANGVGTHAVRGGRVSYPGVGAVVGRAARVRRGELPVVARLSAVERQPDGTLRLTGFAYVRNAGPGRLVLALAQEHGTHRLRRFPTRTISLPPATDNAAQELHDYDRSGFETVVDPARLGDGEWTAGVVLVAVGGGGGAVRRAALRPLGRSEDQPRVYELAAGRRLVAAYREGRLVLSVRRYGARVEGHRVVEAGALGETGGDTARAQPAVELFGSLHGPAPRPTHLSLHHPPSGMELALPVREAREPQEAGEVREPGEAQEAREAQEVRQAQELGEVREPPGGRDQPESPGPQDRRRPGFAVRIPLAGLMGVQPAPHTAPRGVEPPDADRWEARFGYPDGSAGPVPASLDLAPGHALGRLCLRADPAGNLAVELTRRPLADSVDWADDGTLTVAGTWSADGFGGARLVLRHTVLREEVTALLTRDGVRFRATVPAEAMASLTEGRWSILLGEAPVRLLTSTGAALPRPRDLFGRRFTAARRHGDRLELVAGSPLAEAERGAYRQRGLRTAYFPDRRPHGRLGNAVLRRDTVLPGTVPPGTVLPDTVLPDTVLRDTVLRDTVLFTGGDSPRAVLAELVARGSGLTPLWVTGDRRRAAPPGAAPVEPGSRAWYEALATARHIVTDDHLPEWFERRPGQSVVQTWHGTPLGRTGTDLTGTLHADHRRIEALPHLARQWSLLVSPSRWATPVLRRALAYEGEVLEAGNPANDALLAADRDRTRARVRAALGAGPDARVVLYAPTYRCHLPLGPSHPGVHRPDPAGLDVVELERKLGQDHLVLVRRHARVAGAVAGGRDVSAHPTTSGLLLAADVLVTDYSGLICGFAHTGRPMLFHTYDLAHYRDTARGFYADFEALAPGPLLSDTGAVAEALAAPESGATTHAGAYTAFRAAFCDLDDGRAAARVVDRLTAGC
ncbi:bifunctional glycosyltransferase/CDP-glycerol:glycerophosphate glycerophosphotransferase [Streptomyces crystallinus]|uniref:bifunctional glycosyltransferase/CDP-glycerol:glycerophosphate glycerophosphotransferase n=1 Tax=Streptomyces crystallinus TaxID=68191 RepID=UPI0031D3D83C